jgi:ABC-type bacteriocin/lantibiotic exporter with double-glycine peptidase domain
MICDEPTAPLDARAKRYVVESLRAAAEGRTLVLVTHRLASFRHVDRIVVLHAGRLVESGRHSELMAVGGGYAELFTIQSTLYGPDPVPAG